MDYNQLELQRETIFKDAVIKGAQQRASTIVERAEIESQRQIQTAMAACEEADHDTLEARYSMHTARQVGAMSHEARRELLAWRAALVDELFGEIEDELAAFAAGGEYPGWLAKQLAKHTDFLNTAEAPVVYLCREDMALADALKKQAPKAAFKQAGGIVLGGLKAGDGKRLFDETLDARLEEEKQRFFAESELWI